MFKAVASNIKKQIEVKDGDTVVDSFTIEFSRLTNKQRADCKIDLAVEVDSFNANLKDIKDGKVLKDAASKLLSNSTDRLKSSIKGWSDFTDADNKPVPFSPENVDKLLEYPEYKDPIELAFVEILLGSAKDEAAKN